MRDFLIGWGACLISTMFGWAMAKAGERERERDG
jgi:hypothetical protein